MKKRAISIVLALLLVVTTVACNPADTKEAPTAPPSTGETEAASASSPAALPEGPEPLVLPIVQEPLTLSCFMVLDPKVSATLRSVGEVASYQEIMKRTNINIEFQHPPAGQESEQFNLMLASNDLADIMYYNWRNIPGGPAKAILENQILPLNDAMAEYAPNITAFLAENPEIKKQSVLDDGTLYMFPMIRSLEGKSEWFRLRGPIYRKDWLDKLGLTVPATLDEIYDVLTAFKTQDPNGNGVADELPFVGEKSAEDPMGAISNFASAFGVLNGFYLEGETVKFGPLEPGYLEYVKTMRLWYSEGLIDPEFTISDAKSLNQKVLGHTGGAYYGLIAANLGTFLDAAGNDQGFDLVAGPWLTGPTGIPYAASADYVNLVPGSGKAIATSNKHVKETIKFLDYFYSEDGILLSNFGIEGESYEMVEGKPLFTDAILNNTKGLSVSEALSQYSLATANDAMIKSGAYFEQISLALPQQKASQTKEAWGNATTDLLLPPLTYTSEESVEFASIMNDVNTYSHEEIVKYIMSINEMEQYEQFVTEINKFNVQRATEIVQAAYNRYQQR